MGKQAVLNLARKHMGARTGSGAHKKMVDDYNAISPRPVGYKANYRDDWCDIFVTWLFDQTNQSSLIGRECGVQRHLNIFRRKGIWNGRTRPQSGDIVIFDWQGHNAGWADHIGIVEKISGNTVTTIEGNTGSPRQVGRRTMQWNANYVVGYARPQYASKPVTTQGATGSLTTIAHEVIRGEWGNQPERNQKLKTAGFDASKVQDAVNNILGGNTKSIEALAQETLQGKHGIGDERKKKLGSMYDVVQERVNELLRGTTQPIASSNHANVTVDGYLGSETISSLQKALGTPVDGQIWGQVRNSSTLGMTAGSVRFGSGGSPMVKALQSKLGVTADGYWGADTTRALQRYLGTPVDGEIWRPSSAIKELQRRLNAGTF